MVTGFPSSTRNEIEQVATDEQAHANFLRAAIIQQGGTPVEVSSSNKFVLD